MKSMTGFGRWSGERGDYSLAVEVSTVNRKTLEVAVSGPREWMGLDRLVSEVAKGCFHRGRIQVMVKVDRLAVSGGDVYWDEQLVLERVVRFRELAARAGIRCDDLGADVLLGLLRLCADSRTSPEWEEMAEWVREGLEVAFGAVNRMRGEEGLALRADIVERIAVIDEVVDRVENLAPEVAPAWKDALLERLRQSGLALDASDERVLKEVCLYVDRSDISEETTRLRSHLVQLRESLDQGEAVGRKLDFILQEVFRETNTIGSKANHLEITQQVIRAKNELERIREQCQNIE